jgi:hypothetical protein
MAESAKQAWGEVGERFSSWGHRVADRYHEAGAAKEAEAEEAERELKRAMKEVFDELSKGVSAVGATLKDSEANKELADAVSAIGDAITATVTEATEAIRSRGGGSTPPSPPPPPPAAD